MRLAAPHLVNCIRPPCNNTLDDRPSTFTRGNPLNKGALCIANVADSEQPNALPVPNKRGECDVSMQLYCRLRGRNVVVTRGIIEQTECAESSRLRGPAFSASSLPLPRRLMLSAWLKVFGGQIKFVCYYKVMLTPARRGALDQHTQAPHVDGRLQGIFTSSEVEIDHRVESKCGRWCQPRDEHLIITRPCPTAQSTHTAENAA